MLQGPEAERNGPSTDMLNRLRADEVGKSQFTYIVLTLRDQHVEVGHMGRSVPSAICLRPVCAGQKSHNLESSVWHCHENRPCSPAPILKHVGKCGPKGSHGSGSIVVAPDFEFPPSCCYIPRACDVAPSRAIPSYPQLHPRLHSSPLRHDFSDSSRPPPPVIKQCLHITRNLATAMAQWFANHEKGALQRELASIYHYYMHPDDCPDGILRCVRRTPSSTESLLIISLQRFSPSVR